MTDHRPRYRCLVCANRWTPTLPGERRADRVDPTVIVRRPGKHSNHRHPGEVRFEKVGAR